MEKMDYERSMHMAPWELPIYQTATFAHPGVGQSTGFDYTRESNPTRSELERIVSSLEKAYDTGMHGASGMAAFSILLELFENGAHFVCSEDLYGGSVRIFSTIGANRGLTFSYVNTADAELVEKAIKKETKALYIETPSNPTMQVTDLRAMKALAEKYGLLLIVDNTFLSPYFQNPIDFGADLVVHSGTSIWAVTMMRWQAFYAQRARIWLTRSGIFTRPPVAVCHLLKAFCSSAASRPCLSAWSGSRKMP